MTRTRNFWAATLLTLALSLAPRVSAQHAEHWHPYLLAETSIGVAVMADVVAEDYPTREACAVRLKEMGDAIAADNPGLNLLGRCTTNDAQTEVAEVIKMLGATPGNDI